jgi:hypothetical protein
MADATMLPTTRKSARQGYFRSADVDRLLTIASNGGNNLPQQWQVGRRMRKDVTSSSTRPVVRAAVPGDAVARTATVTLTGR